MNETKSIHGTFTLLHGTYPKFYINNQPLSPAQCVLYLNNFKAHETTQQAPTLQTPIKTYLDLRNPTLGCC
ncbi:Uncharacterized protein FWK35_00038773 [Aphis craccivora]|uniref:Uncharacterized protein n=1 Tax=Aphis craccivora TaxID=307492 RepID=A0A6G0VQ30_APHCR|nr:Uncharacterized protein FWK35_00038773 [Aphis craccivora]